MMNTVEEELENERIKELADKLAWNDPKYRKFDLKKRATDKLLRVKETRKCHLINNKRPVPKKLKRIIDKLNLRWHRYQWAAFYVYRDYLNRLTHTKNIYRGHK